MVECLGEAVVVSDLGSTNGTTVDGVRLRAPRVLGPGHVVRFGRCTLELSSPPVVRVRRGRIVGARTFALGRVVERWTAGGRPVRSSLVVAARRCLAGTIPGEDLRWHGGLTWSSGSSARSRHARMGGRWRSAAPGSAVCCRSCWPMPVGSCLSIVWSRRCGRATLPRRPRRGRPNVRPRLRRVLGDGHVIAREPGVPDRRRRCRLRHDEVRGAGQRSARTTVFGRASRRSDGTTTPCGFGGGGRSGSLPTSGGLGRRRRGWRSCA